MANLISIEGNFNWEYNNIAWDSGSNRWEGHAYTFPISFAGIKYIIGNRVIASLSAEATYDMGAYMYPEFQDTDGHFIDNGDIFLYIQNPPPTYKDFSGPVFRTGLLDAGVEAFDIALWVEYVTSQEFGYSLDSYLVEGFDDVPDNSVIEGVISYTNGEPIQGATIEYAGFSAITDDSGYYKIEITPEDIISSPNYNWPDNKSIISDLIVTDVPCSIPPITGTDYWEKVDGVSLSFQESIQYHFSFSRVSGLITTPEDLDAVRYCPFGSFLLVNDLDLSSFGEWIPIDNFSGEFDGQGKEISGLSVNNLESGSGLFSSIGSTGVVKNFKITGADISGPGQTGALAGINQGTVENCSSEGTVNSTGGSYTGGLVGYNTGTIRKSFSLATVNGDNYVGGLAGLNFYGTIENCYARGDVTGTSYVGGFCGKNDGEINYSYSTGRITASSLPVGGFSTGTGSYLYCYYDMETSGQDDDDGRGLPRNSQEMKYPGAENTYLNWDFDTIWVFSPTVNDGYPAFESNNLVLAGLSTTNGEFYSARRSFTLGSTLSDGFVFRPVKLNAEINTKTLIDIYEDRTRLTGQLSTEGYLISGKYERICYPLDSILEMVNLAGSIEDIQDNLSGYGDETEDYLSIPGDNQWLNAVDIYTNVTLQVSFPEPKYIPAVETTDREKDAVQYFSVLVRKANPDGVPVLQLSLFYDGELILKSRKIRVLSSRGQVIRWQWNLGLVPDLKVVECKIESFYTGYGEERSGLDIGAINWCGLYDLTDQE